MDDKSMADAIKAVMNTVEYFDDFVKNNEYYYSELMDAAVFLQVAVNRLVWRLNEMRSRLDDDV